jgi:cytochrome c-type biogenesis protein CcmH/NrfG
MHTDTDPQDYLLPLLRQLPTLDPASARPRLEAAAQEHPRDPRPLALMAAEHAQAKAYDEAEAAFVGALRRDPEYAPARFQLGLLQLSSGRPAAARMTWDPLAALPEGDPYRTFATGLNHLAQDRFTEAAQWLRAGIAANTVNPALNRDMQRFLERIAPDGPPPDNGTDAETAGEHFLVSAYRLH